MVTVNSREDFLREVKKLLPDSPICVELGVLSGDFSQTILELLSPKKLYLIDPFNTIKEFTYGGVLGNLPTAYSTPKELNAVIDRFNKEIVSSQVTVMAKLSYEAVSEFEDELLDFIYIDASHLYEDVKKDLNDWVSKLNPNGIIGGHDYIVFDDFGVIPAVDQFCKEHNFEMIILNSNGGDFALKRK